MSLFDNLPKYLKRQREIKNRDSIYEQAKEYNRGVISAGCGPGGWFRRWIVTPFDNENRRIKGIIVAHEGDWITNKISLSSSDLREYTTSYHTIQDALGINLKYIKSEYCATIGYTLIRYEFENTDNNAILYTPATGEEIRFKIYGILHYNGEFSLMIDTEA